MIIGKQFRFEASHRLTKLPEWHQCHRLHGHSYKVEVQLQGDLDEHGMVLDYGKISDVWKIYLEPVLDHQHLNDVLQTDLTTAETIATYILKRFINELGPKVFAVKVWETETSYAEAYSDG